MKRVLALIMAIIMLLSLSACGKKITDIYLSHNTAELEVEEHLQLTYTVFPEDAKTDGIKWTSANKDIATVDENGNVKAVSIGSTTIICTAPSGKKASCELTVKAPSAIKQLNEAEKGLFDYMVNTMLNSFYNPSAVRIKNIYGDASVSTALFTLDIQGTNKLGGTVSKQYLFVVNNGKYSYMDATDSFNRSTAKVMDPTSMDYAKINAALEEHWTNKGVK